MTKKQKTPKKSDVPWVEKYRPQSMQDMALPTAKVKGHRVSLAEELTKFIKIFFKEIKNVNEENKKIRTYNRTASNKDQKKEVGVPLEKAAVLLEGPPGVGKTSIVYALANDLNMEVIETNASDSRTKSALESRLKETTKSRGIMDFITESKDKLILIDEVDGIYGVKDRGAVPTIIDLVQNTQFPIVMCSNEYKQNLQSLYNKIQRFEVSPLKEEDMLKIAKNILRKENIANIQEEEIRLVINKNNGDLRGVINDLQGICQGSEEENNLDLIMSLKRDSTEEIFGLIRELFQNARTLQEARFLTDKSDVDYSFLYKWISENLPTFIKLNEEIADAMSNLALADEIFGRIRKNQYWVLLPYFYDIFAGGVALSMSDETRTKGFRQVSFPRYGSTFSLNAAEKSIVEKIKTHYENISQIEAIRDFLPFLKILASSSRRQLKIVSEWLELDAREKNLLKK